MLETITLSETVNKTDPLNVRGLKRLLYSASLKTHVTDGFNVSDVKCV